MRLCKSSSVYITSRRACASAGLSTVNLTALTGQERYRPEESRTAIVNSSWYANSPVIVSPEARVTLALAFAPRGYIRRCSSFNPSKRLATPARSPVGEWQDEQPPSPLKYFSPACTLL